MMKPRPAWAVIAAIALVFPICQSAAAAVLPVSEEASIGAIPDFDIDALIAATTSSRSFAAAAFVMASDPTPLSNPSIGDGRMGLDQTFAGVTRVFSTPDQISTLSALLAAFLLLVGLRRRPQLSRTASKN